MTIEKKNIADFNNQFFLAGFMPLLELETDRSKFDFNVYKLMAAEYFYPGSDEYFMAIAILISHSNISMASPNPCVGCVVVKDQKIISYGVTEKYGGLHAEKVALSKLSDAEIETATIFTTLEPCSHHGKQPPCTDLIISKKISRVVISIIDPDPLVNGDGHKKLIENGIEVKTDVLKEATKKLLAPFLANRTNKKIIFIGKWAQSVDGCLCDNTGSSKWISSTESRRYTHWLRSKYDSIMIGANTLIADAPALNIRENFGFTQLQSNPVRIVVDHNLKLLKARNFDEIKNKLKGDDNRFVILTNKKPQTFESNQIKNRFEEIQDSVFEGLSKDNMIPTIESILKGEMFKKRFGEVYNCLVEGGPTLHSIFLKNDSYNFCHIFIAPIFLGGKYNIIQNLGFSTRRLSDPKNYHIVKLGSVGLDCLLELKKNSQHRN